jgi:hypothetical protein
MSEVYDLSREDLVLRKFFEDSIIQSRICNHLDPDLFDDQDNKRICDFINRFHKKFSKYPSAQELITALPKGTRERTKLMVINNTTIPTLDRDFTISMIESFFREKQTEKVLTNAAEFIHDGQVDNIGDLVKELHNAVNFTLNLDIGLHLSDDAQEALDRLNVSLCAIPAALELVRRATSPKDGYGGHYRKALSVYYGMPNVGKSILLCNDAAYAYQAGFNVLYVTMEMAEELIWERITANITDIELGTVRGKSALEIQELLAQNKLEHAEKSGNLYVKAMPTSATVVDIENEIVEIKRTKGIDIDLLVVDYIGIMKAAKRSGSFKDHTLYTLIKEVAEQLRDLAKSKNIAVVTASQLKREGYENKEASMKDVAGSVGLNDTADFVITITQDPLLKSCGLFAHMILKNRFGANSVSGLSRVDYNHMRVRSATAEDIDKYNEQQINQTQTIPEFNANTFEVKGSVNSATNSDRDKNVKKHNSLKGRNNSSNDKGKNISSNNIDNDSTDDELSADQDTNPLDEFNGVF